MLFEIIVAYLLFAIISLMSWSLISSVVAPLKKLDSFDLVVSHLAFGLFWPVGLVLVAIALTRQEKVK